MRKLVFIVLVVLAAVAATGCSSGGEDGGGVAGATIGDEAGGAARSAVAGEVTGADEALSSPQRNVSGVPEIGPQIVQTSSVRLAVRRGRFDETVDEARSIAAGLGGFVVSSSASQGSAERLVRGTLVLRIPAKSYADAMKSLAGLGRVEGRQENGQDVSQEYVDLRARIRQLQAVESQLLQLLDRTDTVGGGTGRPAAAESGAARSRAGAREASIPGRPGRVFHHLARAARASPARSQERRRPLWNR